MDADNPRKTDAELLGMLDEPGGWMVRAADSGGSRPLNPR
jgi:hypothetical protein